MKISGLYITRADVPDCENRYPTTTIEIEVLVEWSSIVSFVP